MAGSRTNTLIQSDEYNIQQSMLGVKTKKWC